MALEHCDGSGEGSGGYDSSDTPVRVVTPEPYSPEMLRRRHDGG